MMQVDIFRNGLRMGFGSDLKSFADIHRLTPNHYHFFLQNVYDGIKTQHGGDYVAKGVHCIGGMRGGKASGRAGSSAEA